MGNLQSPCPLQMLSCPVHLQAARPVHQCHPLQASHPAASQRQSQQPSCSAQQRSVPRRRRQHALKAASVETQEATSSAPTQEEPASQGEPEYYELTLEKPLGIQLARGLDSAAYVVDSNPAKGATDDRVQVGDKVVNVSASFGTDIWDAKNYGQVLYAIKTRNGDVFLRFQKMYGNMSALQPDDTPEEIKRAKAERAGGNYGANTQWLQAQNYAKRQEDKENREKLFNDALGKFRASDIDGALVDFENVIALEPPNRKKNTQAYTQVFRVAQYNVACCYSVKGVVEPGLEALKTALDSGFEGFQKIREDPNLEKLRQSPQFQPLIDEYDEPVLSSNTINAIKNFFSFGRS